MSAATCARCNRPFKLGERMFRATVITSVGAKLAHVCRCCRRLLEHDDAAAEAFVETARAELTLAAIPIGGHA